MVKAKVTKQVKGDITTVTVTEFVPHEDETNFTDALPLGASARDTCGDGTDEFLHNDPLAVWKQFPVRYFIEDSVPTPTLVDGVVASFDEFNRVAGDLFYERTTDESEAKVNVRFERIDESGRTLAQAQWSWRSGLELTRATITFDSSESWGVLAQESCGSTGRVFDLVNVGVHEVGHISGLAHAPTDQLQTMYASTSAGKTLGRSLGNGDIKGFREAYDLITPPPPPPCDPIPCPPNMHFDMELCRCVEDLPPPPPPPLNQKPIADPQIVETSDRLFDIELTGSDPDNNLPLTYRIRDFPIKGDLINIEDNVVTYNANADFLEGTDQFTFTVTDSLRAESDPAAVTIKLTTEPLPPPPPPPPVNEPPTAESFEVDIEEDESAIIELEGFDPENQPLTYEIVREPEEGIVEFGEFDDEVEYTPDPEFIGQDSFDYVAIDDKNQRSNVATVTINVEEAEEPEPEECVRPDLPRRPTLEQIISFVAQMIEYIRCRQNQS